MDIVVTLIEVAVVIVAVPCLVAGLIMLAGFLVAFIAIVRDGKKQKKDET